jgi:hypothetical protein
VVTVLLAALVVGAALIGVRREPSPAAPSPTPSPDLHPTGAVTVPMNQHYDAEAEAGNAANAIDQTDSAASQVGAPQVVAYTAPQARAGAMAQLERGSPPGSAPGFPGIEAPRGTPVYIYVRPLVDAEGTMTVGGLPVGSGHTELASWRLIAGSSDGPAGQDTAAGAVGEPATPVVQQWDSPDRIGAGGAQPYLVALDVTVRTRYPDGQSREYTFPGTVSVTVGFAASSG